MNLDETVALIVSAIGGLGGLSGLAVVVRLGWDVRKDTRERKAREVTERDTRMATAHTELTDMALRVREEYRAQLADELHAAAELRDDMATRIAQLHADISTEHRARVDSEQHARLQTEKLLNELHWMKGYLRLIHETALSMYPAQWKEINAAVQTLLSAQGTGPLVFDWMPDTPSTRLTKDLVP